MMILHFYVLTSFELKFHFYVDDNFKFMLILFDIKNQQTILYLIHDESNNKLYFRRLNTSIPTLSSQ